MRFEDRDRLSFAAKLAGQAEDLAAMEQRLPALAEFAVREMSLRADPRLSSMVQNGCCTAAARRGALYNPRFMATYRLNPSSPRSWTMRKTRKC
jgi:hypothetical protein